jgi:branched-chain amino acid transport system ATP-binding protein
MMSRTVTQGHADSENVPERVNGAVLEVTSLSVAYERLKVVRDVSLSVGSGQVVALLGANGAGKTTTLRTISGLLPVAGGEIRLAGRTITGLRPHAIARQGLVHVPEGRGIFPALTVKDNIEMLAHAAGVSTAEAGDRIGEMFPVLLERADQHAGTLSGGQQQMLALSHALLGKPRLVMLDEISLGLAPKIVESLMDVVRRIAETGVAMLIVEQYVTMALQLADYVYVLDSGRVVDEGSASEVGRGDIVKRYLGGA